LGYIFFKKNWSTLTAADVIVVAAADGCDFLSPFLAVVGEFCEW